ncbi:MAG: nucleotide exchange factor GrpE [Nitrospirae bacterium]|nr:nucleotide exchange factor GrpE [Nitrospirota bacterium]
MNPKKTTKKQDKTDETKAELEQMTEMAKRAMADLQNLKRRQEEEKFHWIKMANADLIKKLLPILDNLDLAKKHMPKGAEGWYKGIEMSINQMQQAMQDSGLTPLETVGQPFDPDKHEAIAQGPGNKDVVIEEFEKGYTLGDFIIRHAKVKVGDGGR